MKKLVGLYRYFCCRARVAGDPSRSRLCESEDGDREATWFLVRLLLAP